MQEDTNGKCGSSLDSITVEQVAVATLPTEWGEFKIAGYRSLISDEEYVVLFKGEMGRESPTLVRIHSQCLTGDVFGSTKCPSLAFPDSYSVARWRFCAQQVDYTDTVNDQERH